MTSPSPASQLPQVAATTRSMPGLVALLRTDGRLEATSPLWEKCLGASAAGVLVGSRPLLEALHAGEDSGEAAADFGGALQPLYWSSRPVDGAGWLVLLERQAAAVWPPAPARDGAQVRENEAHFRLIAEGASDVIGLHDPEGSYLYVSPSVRRVLGYEPEEIIGKTPYALIHPEDAARVRHEDHETLLRGEPVMSLLRMRRKDGTYAWIETLARPICDDEGHVTHLRSSTRDVTERVQAEQALAQINQTLEQRNRELQDFAYVASHDLQEPLRKIRAFTDLLEQDNAAQLDEQGHHYLERISDAAGRMSRLISDLLAFSRVTTRGQPFYEVNLGEIIEEVLGNLEIALQESHGQVEVGKLPAIEADAMQMRQLFQNLIGNALKFRDPDRPPRVQIRPRLRRNGRGNAAVIEVADNGIGFDEKYLDRIFTPFQRLHTRQQYAGTGMGLAICRRIVERHQGQITARSTPGAGTTFIVTLPCTQPSPTELPTQS